MEKREKEIRQTENQVKGLRSYLLGRLGTCWGFDELTRKELIAELREIEAI